MTELLYLYFGYTDERENSVNSMWTSFALEMWFMWLKRNNRCPVCRFELPGDTYNRDHY